MARTYGPRALRPIVHALGGRPKSCGEIQNSITKFRIKGPFG